MKLLRILFAFLLFATPALADANPTLWHVKGPKGEVYLLGSIHILPPDVRWRSPAIAAAAAQADTFVFEVPLDAQTVAKVQDVMATRGYLPANQTLRGLLHPQYRDDYDAALAASGVDPGAVSRERPWLAGLQMMFAQIARLKFDPSNGPDTVLMKDATAAHKQVRYLETVEDQFAVLAPADPRMDLEEFESSLKDLRDVAGEIQPMVAAWSAGDQKTLDELVNGGLDDFPAARKALLDDRNARWVPQIEAMLRETHVFFITVGAGHLTGAKGVPQLLRRAGYRVEGP